MFTLYLLIALAWGDPEPSDKYELLYLQIDGKDPALTALAERAFRSCQRTELLVFWECMLWRY